MPSPMIDKHSSWFHLFLNKKSVCCCLCFHTLVFIVYDVVSTVTLPVCDLWFRLKKVKSGDRKAFGTSFLVLARTEVVIMDIMLFRCYFRGFYNKHKAYFYLFSLLRLFSINLAKTHTFRMCLFFVFRQIFVYTNIYNFVYHYSFYTYIHSCIFL